MQQRLNVLTLGVDDVERARSFYEALGWKIGFTDGDIVMFQAGPMIISLWDRTKLAADSGVPAGTGWGGFTMGYAVAAAEEVDELCRRATEAGATVTAGPQKKGFGYSGVFADPDGHTWEVAWIEALRRNPDGTVELPS
jgi:predicted lactoylglutathione lyase